MCRADNNGPQWHGSGYVASVFEGVATETMTQRKLAGIVAAADVASILCDINVFALQVST
jgi:hypothetical protein